MEASSNLRLVFEVKEIAGCLNNKASCEIAIGERRQVVMVKTQITLDSLEVDSNSTMGLTIWVKDKNAGSVNIGLVTLFGESLQGKLDKWFKIKSEDYSNLRIKLSASLTVPAPEKEKPKRRASKRPDSRSSQEPKCPYLEALAQGKSADTEALDNLWKNREIVPNGQIKISLEPDSPSRLEEPEFNCEEIESITLEKLQQMTGSRLKELLKVLCVEAKQFEVISGKLPEIKEEFNRKVAERRGLEKSSQKEIDEIRENWISRHEEIVELLNKRNSLKGSLREKQEHARALEEEYDALKSRISEAKLEGVKIFSENVYLKLIQSSKQQKESLEESIENARRNVKISQDETAKEIKEINSETESLRKKIHSVNQEYSSSSLENNELKRKINEIKSRLRSSESVKSEVESSKNAYSAQLEIRNELNNEIKSFADNLTLSNKEINEKVNELCLSKQSLAAKLVDEEVRLESLLSELSENQKKLYEAAALKISQEQICCIRADLSDLNEELKRLKDLYADSRAKLLPDLEVGSRILLEESEKVLIMTEKLDQMIETVDQKEGELDGLKNAMGEVQKRQVLYVPVKNDPVDVALAEYLSDKEMQIKFIRQDGGNYLFGSKKIYIKYENQKLLVKVGGGFTSIDEFLNIYTPLELEKIESSPRGGSSSPRKTGSISPSKITKTLSGISDSESRSPKKN